MKLTCAIKGNLEGNAPFPFSYSNSFITQITPMNSHGAFLDTMSRQNEFLTKLLNSLLSQKMKFSKWNLHEETIFNLLRLTQKWGQATKLLNKLSSKKQPYKPTYIQSFSRIHSDLWNVKLKPGFVCTDKMPFISSLKVNTHIVQLSMDRKCMRSL